LEPGPALAREAQTFGRVTATESCRSLIHAFFLREVARKRTLAGWFPAPAGAPVPLRKIGIVGAGVMGSGIAQWLAGRGYDVVLRDSDPAAIARGLGVVDGLFADAVRRGRMDATAAAAGRRRIAAAGGWAGFEECDLVIEAIV